MEVQSFFPVQIQASSKSAEGKEMAPHVEMKNILKDLEVRSVDDFDGRDKAYWIQRVGEVTR